MGRLTALGSKMGTVGIDHNLGKEDMFGLRGNKIFMK